jgi:transposase-like protein
MAQKREIVLVMTSKIEGKDVICFHCNSPNVYWHFEFQRWECVDCGSYVDKTASVVKSYYLKGCVRCLGMIRAK